MSGLDHWRLFRHTRGPRGAHFGGFPGFGGLAGFALCVGLLGCTPAQNGGAGQGGAVLAGGNGTDDTSGAIGQPVLAGAALEKLAATTDLDLPGEIVRSGRYLYSHTDIDGDLVTTMGEDFALARVAGGHIGKAHVFPIDNYGEAAVIAFTLDENMRLRSLLWRCACEAPQLQLEAAGEQLVITPIRDGVRGSSEHIALQYDWTLTQFQVLSWTMLGSVDLQVGDFKTWHLVDIGQNHEVSLLGDIVITRHADKPLPEPGADQTALPFYTAESIIPGQADDPEFGPDPPEQIWTDDLGCPLLTLDESADAFRSVWRMELVDIPEHGAAPASPTATRRALVARELPPELAASLDELAPSIHEAADEAPCPPAAPQSHCVVLTLHPRARARASEFVARAARDGIEVHHEDGLWSAHLADADIVRHFGGRVDYRRVAASASSTGSASQCNAYLEDVKIPARYRPYLTGIAVGHQICE